MAHLRKTVIGGNWKMNLLPSDVPAYAEKLKKSISGNTAEAVIIPPFVMLPFAIDAFCGSSVLVAAQNVSEYDSGAYTGEVSARQLHNLGITHVLAGHSERRTVFGETDAVVNKKVLKILEHSMSPILCIGETEAVRNAGETEKLLSSQLDLALKGVGSEDICRVIIAYEPVWAIGTGKTATSQQAEDACAFIRNHLARSYGSLADSISIIYGGSMNTSNCKELLACENIDGGLVGGASLKADSFAEIINTANSSI